MSFAHRVSFQETWKSSYISDGRPENTVWHHSLMNGGSISVQERLTGYGWSQWDVETGYRSPCGQFWLASGDCDIRDYLDRFNSEEEMINWVIRLSNNCTGGHFGEYPHWTLEQFARYGHQPDSKEQTP